MALRSIFVTGATGFVGRHLCTALGLLYPQSKRRYLRRQDDIQVISGWEAVSGDVRDEAALTRAFQQDAPDLVIHLAAQSSVASAQREALGTWEANVGGALALSRAISLSSPGALLLAVSSADVYGASFNLGDCDETTLPVPVNPYARSKLSAEGIFCDADLGQLIIVRPFNHSGAGQDERFALPSFAAQIARMETGRIPPILNVGDLSPQRDFLDVRDVVDAYLALIAKAESLPRLSLFVIARGEAVTLSYLLDELRRQARVQFTIEIDQERLRRSDFPRTVGNAAALKRAVGWAPQRSHPEMLASILDYWRARA